MSVLVKENGELAAELPVEIKGNPSSQIVSRKPGFIIEWAFLWYIVIFFVIIAATCIIRYPEIVHTKAVLSTTGTGKIYYAKIDIPRKELGRMIAGQRVRLFIEGYSRTEFGFVPGILREVSDTTTANGVTAYVELPAGLTTSLHKVIPYRLDLQADAIVFIKDMRLIQRIFNRSATRVAL